MEQEYTISTGMKVFYGLLAAGMFVFAVFLLNMHPYTQFLLLIPLIISISGALILINVFRRKVVIYNDCILVVSIFATKQLDFNNIKGCRVGQKTISIVPVSPEYPKIMIGNYSDFANDSQLVAFINEKFKDIDKADMEESREAALQDVSLGATETERKTYVKKANNIAIGYNVGGFAFGFACAFINKNWSLIILLLYPLLGIMLMCFNKRLIKFVSNHKTSVYGFVMPGILFSSFILLISSFFDYTIYIQVTYGYRLLV
jgi:hypothetical protein